MKYTIARFALALSLSLALCPIASQAQLLDRLKKKGDELNDIDEALRRWNAGLDQEGRLVVEGGAVT